jgi:hypothetical protein
VLKIKSLTLVSSSYPVQDFLSDQGYVCRDS